MQVASCPIRPALTTGNAASGDSGWLDARRGLTPRTALLAPRDRKESHPTMTIIKQLQSEYRKATDASREPSTRRLSAEERHRLFTLAEQIGQELDRIQGVSQDTEQES